MGGFIYINYMRTTYLHVSYVTSNDSGSIMHGDMLINIKSKANINDLREYILERFKEEKNYKGVYQLPTILSITPLKKKLYRQLANVNH